MKNSNILLLPLSSLSRIGPALTKYLSKLISGEKIIDLLLHKPLRSEEIKVCPRLFEIENNELVVLKLKVAEHIKPDSPRQPYKVLCFAPSGHVSLVFFKIFPSQTAKLLVNSEIAVLGYLEKRFIGKKMELQISHPQEILPANEIEKMPKINVIYPLTAGITQKFLSQKIKDVLLKISEKNEEWINPQLVVQQGWPNFYDALRGLHYLKNISAELSRKRLAYDEFLAWQIAILFTKKNFNGNSKKKKNSEKIARNLVEEFYLQLPFKLTNAQDKAIKEILSEINSDKKMLRLLQGDVGSGKTVVAISVCLEAISLQKQTCIIAPITILAKQHFAYFKKLLEALNIRVELLTSATTKKQKAKILDDLSAGKIDILIGTHAILEDDIKFKNLGMAVIDEQHRFGVMQRLKLVEKGTDCDVLLMSATPIPRSLMMGLYGDMDISILNEKPKNRQKIETLVMSEEKLDQVYESIKRIIAKDEKIYWICPAIEEMSEEEIKEDNKNPLLQNIKLVSAKEKFNELSKIFGTENVALIHGKMKESEKDKTMVEFAESGKILVATTVIEVGIDIADATIIIIENAEHFGLSQLHQLRGRVGRSDKKSFCILLYGEKFGANGKRRLNILRESDDGFFIAEEDLKMRGSGDLLGTKQSGFPEFKIADLNFDSDLLKMARKNAEMILSHDSALKMSESQKYHELLDLFGYNDCFRMVESG